MAGALRLVGGSDELPDVVNSRGDLCGKGAQVGLEDQRHKGVAAGIEHALGELLADDQCLGVEAEKHGVGFPTTNKFDGVGINVGAEESGGAPRAHGAGADEVGRNSGGFADGVRCFAWAHSDVSVGDFLPLSSGAGVLRSAGTLLLNPFAM